MGSIQSVVYRIVLLAALCTITGCVTLPENYGSSTSFAIDPGTDTRLSRAAENILGADAQDSAYLLLGDGLDALVARAALARVADKSIDVQYYLLHNDEVGRLFVEQLLKAAERGVRVRLLVDDMDMEGRELGSAVLDAHPNIEVRLFNPFSRDSSRLLQYISGFGRQTRRSHNKSFTVDSIATIIGGRNIGNAYFVADPDMAFIDLDVMAVGPAASLVAGSFDLYWNNELSYPISRFVDTPLTGEQRDRYLAAFKEDIARQGNSPYVRALQESRLAGALSGYPLEFIRGKSRVFWDHPGKLLNYGEDSEYMLRDLMPYLNGVKKELLIISPYFVPGKAGTEFFTKLRERGVRVVILTNSLESTDVSIVHAGYANYRERLLASGVELYELNRDVIGVEEKQKKWKFYQSKASLHAKCFVMDRETAFIGSLNLDPRSVIHNTEIGMIIESPEIANKIVSSIERELGGSAFRLELRQAPDNLDFIVWHGMVDGRQQTLRSEPYSDFWKRFFVGLMRLLPIESQL